MEARSLPAGVSHALDRYARSLRDRFGSRVAEIVLFGSHARGDATEDSDVDVLVTIDAMTDEERVEVIDLAYAADAASADWVGLSVLVYATSHATRMRGGGRRLFEDIDREGLRL